MPDEETQQYDDLDQDIEIEFPDTEENVDINVDLVFCIDATGSMKPVLNMIKDRALNFHHDMMESLLEHHRVVKNIRIKVIAFRDFEVDGEKSIEESAFFSLPQEAESFKEFVEGIEASGGGDVPETAMDAIAIAMKSDWVKEGFKKRHIIVVWTDAPTKEVGFNPDDTYPRNYADFVKWWSDLQENVMDNNAKRLIVFAPEDKSWDFIEQIGLGIQVTQKLGEGLSELNMETVLETISNSV